MTDEIWKRLDWLNVHYEVSNFGRIRNTINNRVLKPVVNKKGYCHIQFHINGKIKDFGLHRLVAIAFIPNPDNKPQIDHIDGNPSNNHIDNLRWVTPKENSNNPIALARKRAIMSVIGKKRIGVKMPAYAVENLKKAIKGKRFGANNPFYGKKHTEEAKRKMSEYRKGTGNPVCQYTKDDVFVKEWRSASVAARELNGHANGIIACCRGKRKTSLGFKWRYKKDE